jgi:hypothetical protein
MTKIYLQETYINATKGYRIDETQVFESRFDSKAETFVAYRKQYGKPVSKVYIDTTDKNKLKSIGWVFQKKEKYTDCNDTYLQETWITLHSKPPTHNTTYYYL